MVPSNAVWRDPARADIAATLRKSEQGNRRRDPLFPAGNARCAAHLAEQPECMDGLSLSLAHLESKCSNIYDAAEVERV